MEISRITFNFIVLICKIKGYVQAGGVSPIEYQVYRVGYHSAILKYQGKMVTRRMITLPSFFRKRKECNQRSY